MSLQAAKNNIRFPLRAPRSPNGYRLVFAGILNAEVKAGLILIPERDMVIERGAQLGKDRNEQQIHCYHMQPGSVHTLFAALAVPAILNFFL